MADALDWRLLDLPEGVDWDQLYHRWTSNPEELEQLVDQKVGEMIDKVVDEIKDISKKNEEFDALIKQLEDKHKLNKTTTIAETIYYDDDYTYYSEPIHRVIDVDELRQRMAKLDTKKDNDLVVNTSVDIKPDVTVKSEENNECKEQEEGTQTDNGDEIMDISVIYEGTTSSGHTVPKMVAKKFDRLPLKQDSHVFAASNGIVTHIWKAGKIRQILDLWNMSVIFDDNTIIGGNVMSNKLIAYTTNCNSFLPIRERVVAYLQENDGQRELYSGTVAEPAKNTNQFRYLIFFDKHVYHYIKREDIYHIYERTNVDIIFNDKEKADDNEVKDYADFLRDYFRNYPERPMVRLQIGDDRIKVRFDNKWETTRVLDLDASLALVEFYRLEKPHKEWIYRGSRRLYDIYKECQTSRTTVKHHGRSTTRVVRRSDNRPHVEWDRDDDKEDNSCDVKPDTSEAQTKIAESIDDEIIVIPTEEANRKRKFKQTARKSTAKPAAMSSTTSDPMRLIDNELFTPTEVCVEQFPDLSRVVPKKYDQHLCSSNCINADLEIEDFYDKNPFHIPIIVGYRREVLRTNEKYIRILYRAPCGRHLRNIHEVFKYLLITQSVLDIDTFTFSASFSLFRKSDPLRALFHMSDITQGFERQPISCVNTVDQTDLGTVVYRSDRFPHPDVSFKPDPDFLSCCDCTDNCLNSNTCSCQQLTLEASDAVRMSKYQYFGYEYKRLNDFIMTGTFECNVRCPCNKRCPNRVVQNGVKCRLQLFKTLKKGWGVRVLHDVPRGTFLCIYAAQILNGEAADKEGKTFGDEYLADLDYIDVCETQKEGYESDVESLSSTTQDSDRESYDNDDEEFKCSSSMSLRQLGSKGRSTSGRKDKDVKPKSRYSIRGDFFAEDFCYSLDAKKMGNIGRYLNHSCEPNCFVQNVFVDTHDLRFPWVSFFAKKDIMAYEELTWDYNYEIGSIPDRKMYCYCGAHRCKKRLL